MTDSKPCGRCHQVLPLASFNVSKGRHASYCRTCSSAYQREYRSKNVERLRAQRASVADPEKKFAIDVKSKYGITAEQYYALLAAQGGVCGICRSGCPSGKRLAVDHDHACCPGKKSCGKCVRGLLCARCNPGLGYFNDDVRLLQGAIDYLTGECVSE